jgi:hypothetical protein
MEMCCQYSKKVFAIFLLVVLFVPSSGFRSQNFLSQSGLELKAGYNRFSNKELNDYLTSHDRNRINDGISVLGTFQYHFDQKIDIVLGSGYLQGKSEHEMIVTGPNSPDPLGTVQNEYKISSIPVIVGLKYYKPIQSLLFRVGVALEYHFTKISYTIPEITVLSLPEYRNEINDENLGAQITAGLKWPLSSRFSIISDVGYRFLKISNLTSDDAFFPENFSVDLSGIFIEGGLSIDF